MWEMETEIYTFNLSVPTKRKSGAVKEPSTAFPFMVATNSLLFFINKV